MKEKTKPTYITSVDDLFKYYVMGSGDELYVSNLISPIVVVGLLELLHANVKIIYFDYRELLGGNTIDLKKNGRVAFKLNKNIVIYKQKYYYYSKNKKKYLTTMIPDHIDKYCNYTRKVKDFALIQNSIFYASAENTTELINEENNLNMSRQTVYLHQKTTCKVLLPQKEAELWEKIRKLGIEASGYYHYDEEFIKINKEVYVRLSLIDSKTRIIIKDILVEKDKFNKEYIKEFLTNSLNGLPIDTIITDGHPAYPKIIEELGANHQSCNFHIMQTLMRPLNRKKRIS